jgi:hypothetical protein
MLTKNQSAAADISWDTMSADEWDDLTVDEWDILTATG